MILFDTRLYRAFQPRLVVFELAAVELIEDLQGEIGKEGWLRAAQVLELASAEGSFENTHVGSIAVEDLVVILDFEDAMFDNAHC